ncbi:SGNH hydrolase-type esterase domain-containing protein [Podospora conica]|nr:SGNH hydrolase-type esterase domain-containing protein [Schizothecium conicum]
MLDLSSSTLRGALSGLLLCSSIVGAKCAGESSDKHWVDIWATMPQLVEPANLPPAPYNGSTGVFVNSTLRQTVFLTQDAPIIRLTFSNAFGATDLVITAASIALPPNNTAGSPSILPNTSLPVTFSNGLTTFTIPPGALALSDPIHLPTPITARSNLAVTLYLASGQPGHLITGHPGSRTTSHAVPGSHLLTADLSTLASHKPTDHWYFLSSIDAYLPTTHTALALLGDSITDGRGSTHNLNNRWPDQLLSLIRATPSLRPLSTLNLAAGGNRILADGLGPAALARLERDVIAHPGVRACLIYIGVNDLGTADPSSASAVADRLVSAYVQIAARLHRAGIAALGATITPMSGPGQTYSDPQREAARGRVNAWIRETKTFDGVVDFDAAVRDPRNATQLRKELDTGDYLHLNPEGYRVMAETVDLGMLERWRGGYRGM